MIRFIFPAHPRTTNRIKEYHLEKYFNFISQISAFKIRNYHINCLEPLGYLEFLQIEENAKLIATDSGGIQEEACILRVPCITLRDNTERPETLEVGANMLAGTNPERIVQAAKEMISREKTWENPFGDGNSGKKIVDLIRLGCG